MPPQYIDDGKIIYNHGMIYTKEELDSFRQEFLNDEMEYNKKNPHLTLVVNNSKNENFGV